MILFFDTETSGLPNWSAPSDDLSQPFIVEFAAIFEDDDGKEKGCFHWIIKPPEGREIPKEASDIHGITTEMAIREGVHPKILAWLFSDIVNVFSKGKFVAHNIKFDLRIMKITLLQNGFSRENTEEIMNKINPFCTMNAATNIVNLPPTEKMLAAGLNKPKAPSLGECYKFFFGKELVDAHGAMADARACRDVYREIIEIGEIRKRVIEKIGKIHD